MEGKIIRKNEMREVDKAQIMGLIKQHGRHSLAYSCLQDCIDYFVIPNLGFIGFSEIQSIPLDRPADDMGMNFRTSLAGLLESQGFKVAERKEDRTVHAFSDPVCSLQTKEQLFSAFLERYPNPCFWQTYEHTSNVLETLGFKTNHFGFETLLDLAIYELTGSKKQNLRTSLNKARSLNYEIRDINQEDINFNRISEISAEWLKGKISNRHELTFLARPLVPTKEEDVRIFGGFKNNNLEGYVVFSPIYENGTIEGYLKDMLRISDVATADFASSSLSDALSVQAIETFKGEGKKILSLGLSPFSGIEPLGNPATSLMFAGIYQSANALYGFENLANSKKNYVGRKERVYFNSKETAPLDQTVDMFRLCRVFD